MCDKSHAIPADISLWNKLWGKSHWDWCIQLLVSRQVDQPTQTNLQTVQHCQWKRARGSASMQWHGTKVRGPNSIRRVVIHSRLLKPPDHQADPWLVIIIIKQCDGEDGLSDGQAVGRYEGWHERLGLSRVCWVQERCSSHKVKITTRPQIRVKSTQPSKFLSHRTSMCHFSQAPTELSLSTLHMKTWGRLIFADYT